MNCSSSRSALKPTARSNCRSVLGLGLNWIEQQWSGIGSDRHCVTVHTFAVHRCNGDRELVPDAERIALPFRCPTQLFAKQANKPHAQMPVRGDVKTLRKSHTVIFIHDRQPVLLGLVARDSDRNRQTGWMCVLQ